MKESTSLGIIMGYLPADMRRAVENAGSLATLTELRLNIGRPAALIFPDKILYLTSHGTTASANNLSCVKCTRSDLDSIMDSITHYSFHSHITELKTGSIMLENGIRAAISGAYNQNGLITSVTGLSFRISRCIEDCSRELLPLVSEKCGILICGGVNSGKTTMLRDLCRAVGTRKKVTLIDERNEIACTANGQICNDVGALTNVLSDCPRAKGIVTAVRNLSPDYIFCDEISTNEDLEAIMTGRGCGVSFCATAHAESMEELNQRTFAEELIKSGIFRYAVFLAGASAPGRIAEIRRLDEDDTRGDITDSDRAWRSSRIRACGQAQK